MTRLPVLTCREDELDRLEIATPCEVSWDAMPGDARIRHCGQCKQNVYNVEALTRGEALRLIAAREGRVCLRIYRRPDGTVVTADCWARLREARRRGVRAFVAVLIVAGFAEIAAVVTGLLGLGHLIGFGRTMGTALPPPVASLPVPVAPAPDLPPAPLSPPPEFPPEMGRLVPRGHRPTKDEPGKASRGGVSDPTPEARTQGHLMGGGSSTTRR